MNKISNIIVFGTESCKFCSDQLRTLQDSLFSNKLSYLDIIKDEGALEMAQDLDLEYTPTTIVLCDSEILIKKTGLISAEELLEEINKKLNKFL